jgi:hypothetical protein
LEKVAAGQMLHSWVSFLGAKRPFEQLVQATCAVNGFWKPGRHRRQADWPDSGCVHTKRANQRKY